MAKSNQRGSNNNNAEGRNQYSGFSGMFLKNPIATTAAAAAASAAAGIFIWSKRDKISDNAGKVGSKIGTQAGKVGNKISEKAGQVGDKFGEWTEDMRSDSPSSNRRGGRSSIPTGTESPRTSQPSTASSTPTDARSSQKAGIPQPTAPQVN